MPKRLAMTVDGKLTYCTADDEHVGKGRCNHVAHQKVGETQEAFLERANAVANEKNKKDDLDLEGLEETKYLNEFLDEWGLRGSDGSMEGVRCVDDGSFRFMRMFGNEDLMNFYDGAVETVFNEDADSKLKTKRLFEELNLPYTGDCWKDSSTLAHHILTQNIEKLNSHPEWGEPRIEDHGFEPWADNCAFGYSWPLDSVFDKLSDEQIVVIPCVTERSESAEYGYEVNRDDPTLQRLYSRAMKIEKAKVAAAAEQKQQIERGDFEHLVSSPDPKIRLEIAQQGRALERLVDDSDKEIRKEVVRHGYGLDKLVNDSDWTVRAEVAKQKYGLDKLVKDPDYNVRCAVAQQGYGLDELVNDESNWVRAAVAKQGYGLDKLMDDPSPDVREAVARQGYGLDKLINDPSKWVRMAVAGQGYGLDQLVNDPVPSVRQKARLAALHEQNKEK